MFGVTLMLVPINIMADVKDINQAELWGCRNFRDLMRLSCYANNYQIYQLHIIAGIYKLLNCNRII